MHINKQLKTIPFDKLFEIYQEVVTSAIEGQESEIEARYMAKLEQLELKYSSNHEAPSETSFGDVVERDVYDKVELQRKTGQKAIIDIWIPRYKLGSLLISVMPQIMAHIANKPFRLSEVTTAEGQIDGNKMLKSAFDFSDNWERGLYLFLMLDSRSSYLPTQYKGEGAQFCSLVPLILYAFKVHHKIPYSKWDRSTLDHVVNRELLKAMLHQGEYNREDLLAARELGTTYQTGDNAGKARNAQSCFKLWATKGGCMQDVPHLAQVMYTQIWCAHPSNRTPYMVLNPQNWDIMPVPLIVDNIFTPVVSKSNKNKDSYEMDLPWNT
jgi:hypothetical protein